MLDNVIHTKEGLDIHVKQAKSISYGGTRPLSAVKYINIHYTGNVGDSAAGNANYFANSNTRAAGAQFFVDSNGIVYRSIEMTQIAYAVGGFFTKANGAGKLYGIDTNSNSVSIELCNYTGGYLPEKQLRATIKLIKYIQRKCPNAKTIARHWDVNGKNCAGPMVGKRNKNWKQFKKDCKAAGIEAKFA
jgi:N-acetylmuramoyl-L-alanine amidase CwlA